MTAPHLALAVAIVMIWASNFIVVKWGLDRMPPLALCTWRFLLSFFPACLLLPAPKGRWRLLVGFGILTGVGQFGMLAIAMKGLISPALASVVVQTQVYFNVGLAALLLREDIRIGQVAGCLIAGCGLAVVAANLGASATGAGILLALLSAFSWALCNVLLRGSGYQGDLVSFLVWTSLFATLPLAALSVLVEGPAPLVTPLARAEPALWLILLWQAYATNLFGYAVWNGLIRNYTLSRISPLTLLVPVVAMALSALLLGEALTRWKLAAAALIILGLSAPYAGSISARLGRLRSRRSSERRPERQ